MGFKGVVVSILREKRDVESSIDLSNSGRKNQRSFRITKRPGDRQSSETRYFATGIRQDFGSTSSIFSRQRVFRVNISRRHSRSKSIRDEECIKKLQRTCRHILYVENLPQTE